MNYLFKLFEKNVEYSALVFNLRGVERAINSGIGKIETSISVSENYNQKNLGLNNKQAIDRLKEVVQFAIKNKLRVSKRKLPVQRNELKFEEFVA